MSMHPALDAAGIARLYETHARKLHWFLMRMTHNDHAAEDLVQETFIVAFKSCDKYNGDSLPETWLFAIARNTFLNRYRLARHDRVTNSLDDVDWEPLTEDVLDTIERNDTLKQIDAAWQKMLPSWQQAMEAVVIDELDYHMAAELLGIPLGTVKSRVHRARAKLCDVAE